MQQNCYLFSPGIGRAGSGSRPRRRSSFSWPLTSEIAAAAMTARMKLPDIEEKERPRRCPIPDHIPRMEVELTPRANACADCGGRPRRIAENVTDELEYAPGRFIVNRIVCPRLTCSCCKRFVQTPLPSRPIERGRPRPGLLVHVLVSKYADHLPLYRQSQIFRPGGARPQQIDPGRLGRQIQTPLPAVNHPLLFAARNAKDP